MVQRLRNILLILVLLLTPSLRAAETLLIGDVVSLATGEAIPNASVYLLGTKIGTATNEEGSFVLKADIQTKHTLCISAVGYLTERFPIEPGKMAGVQVSLRERNTLLTEVVATPGENPALEWIRKIQDHRAQNDRKTLGTTNSLKHVQELYISDIQPQHLRRRLWKSLESGMIEGADSTWLLPLYSSEHGALILSETDYRALLSEDGDLCFYDHSISLMGRSFLSPLARSGTAYYRYYLADSLSTEQGKTYEIHFRSRNPYYETLNGSLTIDSATCAILSIDAEVPRETSVNYLRGATIRQRYAEDHSLSEEDIRVVMDFAVKTDNSHIFPTVLIHNSRRSEETHNPLATNEANTEAIGSLPSELSPAAMDSLMDLPLIRTAKWLATIITTGYIPTGTCVDFGHIQEILQVNRTEGVHVGLPLRTNERLMKHVSLEAAIGYGFKNQKLTGLGRVSAILPAPRRHLLIAEYQDHLVWPEENELNRMSYENSIGRRSMDFSSYAFEALYTNTGARNTLTRQQQFMIRTENDWTDILETELYLKIGKMGFHYETLGGILRLGWNERKVDHYMRRIHIGGAYPTLYLLAEFGSWSPDTDSRTINSTGSLSPSYLLYSRIGTMLRQNLNLGMGGTLDYNWSAGYIIGEVPELLLYHFSGNQTYGFDPYRFTLMNNGQFNARLYTTLHLSWNGQGILFNMIPGVRYLRLRELVSFKMAWGYNPDKTAPQDSQLLTPYTEIGVGIGNILRVADLYSVWRLTHRDDITAPKWSMRFRIHIDL